MKKIILMASMVAIATAATAQDNLWKKASSLCESGKLDEAAEMIAPCLNSSETLKKADAWNAAQKIYYNMFMEGQKAEIANKTSGQATPYDTLKMHRSLVKALEAAMKCDEYDRAPNEKGKVKIKFRAENQKTYGQIRAFVINSGLYEYQHGNNDEALKDWTLYLESEKDELFTGMDLSNDPYRADVAYYAGLVAYQKKDYATAMKYAEVACQDTAKVRDASEILIFSKKDKMKTKEDSIDYVNTVKKMHALYPDEPKFYNLLTEYYNQPGRQTELAEWVNEEIQKDPNNKMSWALKGEVDMNNRKWDDAIANYKKALDIDPEFVPVIFNIGVCMNSKAIDLKDQLADKKTGRLTVDNANKVKAILSESKTYLEKVQSLDPGREKVNWAYPLYQIYYSLGDKEKTAQMESLLEKK